MKTCGGADKEAEKRADYAELYRAVNSLKEELRLPVILYYIEDFNIRDCADTGYYGRRSAKETCQGKGKT